ncbi:MAG: glycosyltransferase [Eubacterium sp.]|nr:glycosyltransferase [Eubacterium sp.]
MMCKGISVVVPCLNESEGILLFCKEMERYAAGVGFLIELVFVDDGSSDNTAELIGQFSFQNIASAKIIRLSKNFGSHAAIRAGLQYAGYGICTWMGSDLQEPVEFLEASMEKIGLGYDAVYIEKESIDISICSRIFSKMYSLLVRKYAVKNYGTGGISNIVFNRKVKHMVNENIESNSAIHLQIMDAGFRGITIPMRCSARAVGSSKWTLAKKIKLFIDSFVSFSYTPLRLVSIVGIGMFFMGMIIGFQTFVNKIINPVVPTGYSTIMCILALGFGITNIALGIIAEYLWRTYDAARKRPVFIVSEIKEIKHMESEYKL